MNLWLTLVQTWLMTLGAEGNVRAKRVMFMPAPTLSQALVHVQLAETVRKLGHRVWIVLPSRLVSQGLLPPLDRLHVVLYSPPVDFFGDIFHPFLLRPALEGREGDFCQFARRTLRLFDGILGNQSLHEELGALRPHLFVTDYDALGAKMLAVFPHRMGVPFAELASTFHPLDMRVPFSAAASPSFLFPFRDKMTFTQRFRNAMHYLVSYFRDPLSYGDAVARYAPEMPYIPLDAVHTGAQLWLLQSDYVLDYPKPTLPNVKLVGGVAAAPAKPLPRKFQEFMDGACKGVAVVSLGDELLNLPKEIGEGVLLSAFGRLKALKVVYRSNATSPDPGKILTSSWIPQNDLLAHPNTRVLVTHCGNSGQYQALLHAVPMVGLPLWREQFYNAERVQAKGFGKVVHLTSISAAQLAKAIAEVARNPAYKGNISKASELFREQFDVPADRAAYWLDHVMQHGGDYMRSAGQRMPLWQSCWRTWWRWPWAWS